MEVTENPDQAKQTESVSKEPSTEPSAANKVSVIQPAPSTPQTANAAVIVNGTAPATAVVEPTEPTLVVNGTGSVDPVTEAAAEVKAAQEQQDQAAPLDIQPAGEQLPEQLLQGDNSNTGVTTVGSLIEQTAAEEPETAAPSKEPETAPVKEAASAKESAAVKEAAPAVKPTATDLAAEWEEEGGDVEMTKVEEKPAKADEAGTIADEDADMADADSETTPRKSGRKVKPTEKVLEGDNYVEESVEAIANELANSANKNNPKDEEATAETPVAAAKAADAGTAAKATDVGTASASKKGRPKKKDLDEKVDNVTKLGNNMYFYTGRGGQDSPPPLNSDDEGEGGSPSKDTPVEAARKSNRAGKGRNPRLEREDEEVEIPKKVPPKPNLNPGWLKDAAKEAAKTTGDKKSPLKKKTAPTTPASAAKDEKAAAPTPEAEESGSTEAQTPNSEVNKETSVTKRTSAVNKPAREASPPPLPEFDPAKFEKGYVPKTVKKGEDEYVIVVQGVQDTGLCGNYWGNTSLPSRRRSKAPDQFKAGDSPDPNKARRGSSGSVGSNSASETTPIKAVATEKLKATPTQPKSNKKQVTKPETPKVEGASTPARENGATPAASVTPATPATEDPEKKKRGRKRKVETPAKDEEDKKLRQETKSPEKSASNPAGKAAVTQALAAGSPAGQQRSVSCVSDTTTQKEVVVECFAPYDDHRWVNIGKERDGMTPDAVQYARALRPPYHLLSFLRIKGHSTKGMSCTDKNTMVFVVLEGEITVILHTTQFNAKKGDSFYIPPKNYYNLINQKAREAELSLIQFQYDGPLPTVNQSAPATSSAPAATAK